MGESTRARHAAPEAAARPRRASGSPRTPGTSPARRSAGGELRLTPRGWAATTAAATAVLTLLAVVLGTLLPGLPDRNAVAKPEANLARPGASTKPSAPGSPMPSAAPPSAASTPPPAPMSSTPPSRPATVVVPRRGSGTFQRAAINLPNKARQGKVIRYTVQVEQGVPVDPAEAATIIHEVLNDKRSWGGKGAYTWLYVPSGAVDLTASITTPDTTDRICAPLNTRGEVSCRNGGRIALNANRWVFGVKYYGDDLVGYRQYLVNHEFGHYIGYGHVGCPGPGKKAPVMMTQTLGLGQCVKNPWPSEDP